MRNVKFKPGDHLRLHHSPPEYREVKGWGKINLNSCGWNDKMELIVMEVEDDGDMSAWGKGIGPCAWFDDRSREYRLEKLGELRFDLLNEWVPDYYANQ